MGLIPYTTDPGTCDKDRHEFDGKGYNGLRLQWEGAKFWKRRLCKEHYLEEFRKKYPEEPEPAI